MLTQLGKVLDAERRCCRFFHFSIDAQPAHGAILLTVAGPAGTGAFLESLSPAFAAPAR
jgi:hypothetical protein